MIKTINGRPVFEQYQDYVGRLLSAKHSFKDTLDDYEPDYESGKNLPCKTVTFQVTDRCNLACTYCYQINKGKRVMSFETAKKFIDLMFEDTFKEGTYLYYKNCPAIVIEFIGGEPLLEIELIDQICEYFEYKCIHHNHPWAKYHIFSMISNGVEYFDPKVQAFLEKYKGKVSFGISLDGCKELHDQCRIFPDTGEGSYDLAVAGCKHYKENFDKGMLTKMTIAPENVTWVYRAITNLIDLGYETIHANCVYESGWEPKHATILYDQLIQLADYLLENDLDTKIYISLFEENMFEPQSRLQNNTNYCGSTGCMLACDPDGAISPCIRFMKSSLGTEVEEYNMGDIEHGIGILPEHKERIKFLDTITRESQSTEECFNCPIAAGCGWCFPAGTLINTPSGLKEIQDINIGDTVLDMNGNPQQVENTISHIADDLIVIKAAGYYDTITTAKHPFWVKPVVKRTHNILEYGEPQWVNAEDIKVSDKIALYVPKLGEEDFPTDLAYIVGRYIGDDWKSSSYRKKNPYRYSICTSFGEAEEFERKLKLAGVGYSSFKNKTVMQYKLHTTGEKNELLISLIDKCGRRANDKCVPQEVYNWKKESIAALLDGYFDADGHLDDKGQRYSSVSKVLVYQIAELIRAVYHRNVDINVKRPQKTTTIEGRVVNQSISYEGRFKPWETECKSYEYDEENNIMWVNVRSSKMDKPNEIEVFNLTVDNNPTYIANGALVHNCSALNYQETGTINKRVTHICIMHKARSLANVYYWNKFYKKHNEDNVFKMNCPKEWALEIITEEEYNKLLELSTK